MENYKNITFMVTLLALSAAGALSTTPKATGTPQLTCPWESPLEMIIEDGEFEQPEKSLTKSEVIEDLLCLKDLMNNYYVAQLYYPEADIEQKINELIDNAGPMTNAELLSDSFSVTDDFYDLHLRFRLGSSVLKATSQSTKTVTVKPSLETERIHEIPNGFYFKPEDLRGDLTQSQKEFVNLIKTSDANFAIDLTGNGGGDNWFATGLLESLYTEEQSVPSTEKIQVSSLLALLGRLNLATISDYRGLEGVRKQVKNAIEGKSYTQILPYELQSEIDKEYGKRQKEFSGNVALIFDGRCGSSCETIIEKLGPHPRVTLIGQNSRGALHFSNAMTFLLPNSRILVSIPTLFHIYENDAPEGIGYSPDTYIEKVFLDKIF